MYREVETADARAGRGRESARAAVPHSLRSHGEIDLSFRRCENGPSIERSHQSGCLRIRLTRREGACAVLINTAGGLAERDSLDQRIAWGEGSSATVTTLAAERVYRAPRDASAVVTRLVAAAGAQAEWLPQETILFDGARLHRDTQVALADDASFLGLEAVVLGRTAMGELVRGALLRDRLRIRRGGRLIYADALALDGDVAARMLRAAIGDGAKAMAVITHVSQRAASLLGPVRDALAAVRGLAAASCWNGLLAVRLLAPDGAALRHDVALALAALRNGRPLPRVWGC